MIIEIQNSLTTIDFAEHEYNNIILEKPKTVRPTIRYDTDVRHGDHNMPT